MEKIAARWARMAAALDGPRRRDDRGATFVEYAMLFTFIAIVCIAAVTVMGNTNAESLSSSASALP